MVMTKKRKTQPTEVETVEPQSPLMGRPSSFDPEFERAAAFLCKHGATDQDLADFFQVTVRTLNRWKIVHPEFAAAIRRGKDITDDRVEDSLYHKAMEREIEQEEAIKVKKITYNDAGKKIAEEERVEIVTVKRTIPADTTAMIFWLKNRRPDAWRDVHKHEHGRPGDFTTVDKEELERLVIEETKELLSERKKDATKH